MVEVHNEPKDFGCGVLLFPAEVHTLAAIHENPLASGTELAAILGVTKGAISQMLTKLQTKSLVIKRFAPGSEKQKRFVLTETGIQAFEGHESYHREMIRIIEKKMKGLTVEDLHMYARINSLVEELIEELR